MARITIGFMVIVGGVLWVPFCLLLALASSNPCGMFGDHCDEYGQVSDTAEGFFYAAFLAIPVVIGGLVMVLTGYINRPRAATP